MRTCIAWKGCPQNDPYCVRQDVKPYSLTDHVKSSMCMCVRVWVIMRCCL